jgi:hypothetical protein
MSCPSLRISVSADTFPPHILSQIPPRLLFQLNTVSRRSLHALWPMSWNVNHYCSQPMLWMYREHLFIPVAPKSLPLIHSVHYWSSDKASIVNVPIQIVPVLNWDTCSRTDSSTMLEEIQTQRRISQASTAFEKESFEASWYWCWHGI